MNEGFGVGDVNALIELLRESDVLSDPSLKC
jgi:hypothetical protein